METDKPLVHALQECEEKVKELKEENSHLRESSHAFGQLAERLNQTLQGERRAGTERRKSARPNGDRRQREVSMHVPADATNDHE
jgi:hypothetical protein